MQILSRLNVRCLAHHRFKVIIGVLLEVGGDKLHAEAKNGVIILANRDVDVFRIILAWHRQFPTLITTK